MTAFSMTPVGTFPPPDADDFPNFVQFQSNGTNLGGPDADVLNFGAGLTATRGEGESANVVTVESDGGEGGGAEAYTASVVGSNMPADGSLNVIEAGFTIYSFGNGVAYNSGTNTFTLDPGYVYEIVVMLIFGTSSPETGYREFGSQFGATPSVHSRNLPSETEHAAPRITDTFLYPVVNEPAEVQLEAYWRGTGVNDFGVGGDILIRQVAPYNPS